MNCPTCNAPTRPAGMDYRLCPNCGPVPDGPPLPEPSKVETAADIDRVMAELGPDGFDDWLGRLR